MMMMMMMIIIIIIILLIPNIKYYLEHNSHLGLTPCRGGEACVSP